jgi:cell division inhibitor SulA
MNGNALDELLQQPGIWRGGEQARSTGLQHISSGFGELDQALPGGGWPLGALTELLHEQAGIGELRLFMPALARLSRQGRWVAMIAPPYIPYAPALAACGMDLSRLLLVHPRNPKEGLWALEQALRTGTCAAVLAWPREIDERNLRRLQLAAETGRSWGVLFRPRAAAGDASPAALRLEAEPDEEHTLLRLLKCRGGAAGVALRLDLERSSLLASTSPAPCAAAAETPKLPQPLPRRPVRGLSQFRGRRPPPVRSRPQLELPLITETTAAPAVPPPRPVQAGWSLRWPRRK